MEDLDFSVAKKWLLDLQILTTFDPSELRTSTRMILKARDVNFLVHYYTLPVSLISEEL